mgnify:CR=1 FL=1
MERNIPARWLFPGDGPPRENVTLVIADGLVQAIEGASESNASDLGNMAIIPGLINAHTHLEFSSIDMPLQPADDFAGWIRSIVGYRRQELIPVRRSIQDGANESLRAGVAWCGDITTAWSADWLPSPGPNVVAFHEVIGIGRSRVSEAVERARQELLPYASDSGSVGSSGQGRQIRRAISPHAPYSVHHELFSELARLSGEFACPLAVHLAETEVELELLATAGGPLRRLLEDFGVWEADAVIPNSRPIDYLRRLDTADRVLVIHGNYLDEQEITFLSHDRRFSVVYCPRTHAYFGHPRHPLPRLLDAGVNVALGTDSRASNPDLSLWGEVRLVRREFPELSGETLLEMATCRGAQALGLPDGVGTLRPGRPADFCVLELPEQSSTMVTSAEDAFDLLFDPQAVFVGPVS